MASQQFTTHFLEHFASDVAEEGRQIERRRRSQQVLEQIDERNDLRVPHSLPSWLPSPSCTKANAAVETSKTTRFARERAKTEKSSPTRAAPRIWTRLIAFEADSPRSSKAFALGSSIAGTPAEWKAHSVLFPDERAIVHTAAHFYVCQHAQQHHVAMNPADLLLNRREIVYDSRPALDVTVIVS